MALLALTLALLAMTVATTAYEEKPLDMAPDSFDDQYQGCGPDMKVELPTLNHSEFQNNSQFAELWNQTRETWWREGSRVSPLSSSDQAIAITAGTMLYWGGKFNEYRDNFHFKTLHFLLTDALTTLRDAYKEQQCHSVFWGMDYTRYKAKPGDIIRFGQFVLLSVSKSVAELFGNTTFFKVQTCHGADIKAFARFPSLHDVLIPPFEKFKVTKVIEKGDKMEIHLDSIGTYSRGRCPRCTLVSPLGLSNYLIELLRWNNLIEIF
uniref:NAD(P)(+)--arginine ADP-ribosyltransferase n=1 Tax=Catharus ustulatus TaxID=91951 RepID=A0A8C3UNX3_CATUS